MTIKEISMIDCRSDKGKEQLQQVLYGVSPFVKYEEKGVKVPMSAIERLMDQICRRYQVLPGSIGICVMNHNELYYTGQAFDQSGIRCLSLVSGVSLYEVMAKQVVLLWSEVQGKKLIKRKVAWSSES